MNLYIIQTSRLEAPLQPEPKGTDVSLALDATQRFNSKMAPHAKAAQ